MSPASVKKTFLVIVLLGLLVILGIGIFTSSRPQPEVTPVTQSEVKVEVKPKSQVIGTSVGGREIKVYSYGTGSTHIAFVGGIHGGYEWNSTLLANSFADYFDAHPEVIPKNITIDIIPSANPDALYKVTGKEGRFTTDDTSNDKQLLASARFNANTVDLNRNFDCKWKPKSTWQSKIVSAGTAAFSEPETKAIRNFMITNRPVAVIFWHSMSNGVYASQCETGILPETVTLMKTYSKASGYPAIEKFDAYETTGAADDWLASVKIPAVTVELKTHETIEWEENMRGVKAVIDYYTKN